MNPRKIFALGICIIIALTIGVIMYAKNKFTMFNYNSYIENSSCNFINSINNNNNDLEGMNYEQMFNLFDYFIDDKISTIDDLINLSDYILIVNVDKQPIYKGSSVINNCTILKVIKGSNFKENTKIRIYDLVFHWDYLRTYYLGGNTPLKINDNYIVFLKKPKLASENETYVFTSVKYGRISILENRGILENYEQSSLNITDIFNYDLVFSPNNYDEIIEYNRLVKEIREFAKEQSVGVKNE